MNLLEPYYEEEEKEVNCPHCDCCMEWRCEEQDFYCEACEECWDVPSDYDYEPDEDEYERRCYFGY